MGKITPWPEQLELSAQGYNILKQNGLLYLAMEERTGKTLTSILVCEGTTLSRILVVTKKKALKGWEDTLDNFTHFCSYTVVNYHNIDKVKGEFDLIIIDEAHAYISGYPKPSKMWKQLKKLCKDKPIIYMSATPYAQGIQLLYHQLALSDWSPWSEFITFFAWFKHFADKDKNGQLKVKYINHNQTVIDYTAVKHDLAIASVEHLFITKTRQELGFEHEPEDVIHYIELSERTKLVYNTIIKDNVIEFTYGDSNKDYCLVCDTPARLRTSLHMIEGGVLKVDECYLDLSNNEKIDYIMKIWGDTQELVIMYHYIAEGEKLRKLFKHAQILQGISYAEGVDLSMYKHLIIYSQDFSTAKHTQRRARQSNKNRKEDIKVHYLLVKKAVSEQVYNAVSVNKENFVDSVFEREVL